MWRHRKAAGTRGGDNRENLFPLRSLSAALFSLPLHLVFSQFHSLQTKSHYETSNQLPTHKPFLYLNWRESSEEGHFGKKTYHIFLSSRRCIILFYFQFQDISFSIKGKTSIKFYHSTLVSEEL